MHRRRTRQMTDKRPSAAQSEHDLDLLVTVYRSDARIYQSPHFIRQRLEENVAEISDEIGVEVMSTAELV